jgi:tripartite-type tricarboxylate transporter receptor subunit TctC
MNRTLTAVAFCLGAAASAQAAGTAYPDKPVQLVVPYTPGGQTDVLGRLIAAKLGEKWNTPVIVENRPGGGATIGTAHVANSAPDGYTILEGSVGSVTNPFLLSNLSYDPKALVPIALVGVAPLVMVVNPKVPVTNIKELVAYAKAKPGSFTFASSGNGSSPHITAELFAAKAGIKITHVPYRGTTPALNDLMGGQVNAAFDTRQTAPYLKAGRLRAIAIASDKRLPQLPDVPTITESGVPGVISKSWFGFFVPRGTPASVQKKLEHDILEVAHQPAVQAKISDIGLEPETMNSIDFATFLVSESEKWGEVIKTQHITVN